MADLVSRLLEAIGETERDARHAAWKDARWVVAEQPAPKWGEEDPDPIVLADGKPIIRLNTEYAGHLAVDHVVRHAPSSVLRRCAADRKTVEAHKAQMRDSDEYDENGVLDYVEIPFCPTCWYGKSCSCCAPPVTADSYPCDPLRWLADVYGLEVTE